MTQIKNLILINGTMGVGKTATCRQLQKRLPNCVFLDGDWCWDAVPFIVNDETKAMVLNNIAHLLSGFLVCSAYDNVLFCWVMHEQSIVDTVVASVDAALKARNAAGSLGGPNAANATAPLPVYTLHKVSLICTKEALKARLQVDIDGGRREAGIVERSLSRLKAYETMDTQKIDVSQKSAAGAADDIYQFLIAAPKCNNIL